VQQNILVQSFKPVLTSFVLNWLCRYSSQGKFTELEDMLYDGAVKFFSLSQTESGVDLTKLYLEILVSKNDSHISESILITS
jgi:hypothetical protein